MNYRSVVVFGNARPVTDDAEKLRVLDSLVEHVMRGRAREVRPPNDVEMKQTLVLALPIEEASAKVRTGGPVDDEEDSTLPVWAGVLPLTLMAGAPVPDVGVTAEVPEYVTAYARTQTRSVVETLPSK
jgi:hypothetical protein